MSTGNKTRDDMLKRAINECVALKEPLIIGYVRDKLPGDFFAKMDPEADAELMEALREMGLTDTPATPAANDTIIEPEAEPEFRLTREQAQSAMDSAAVRLDNARVNIRVQQGNCRTTRAVLARAITGWQEGAAPMSDSERVEREKRNHIAGEQMARAQRRKAHGGAAAFAQKRMVNGPQRGAFSMQAAARLGFKMPTRG
jgi:hypothetical protein